ncbi:alpha/beta hydrolase family protein [Blastococcus colisei]|uniref:Alpha/beta hydrolase family protein n=1 Tax=Blastococcus colisei TaxID=1564162 RepID=A0A543PE89_9ACTN|nr:alpha/beta hydrolase [Blastococcus colisei]TQN42398.1 alpha/beta hydrolase family protein [Blastococcus colisei]
MHLHRGRLAVPSTLLAVSLVLAGCTSFSDSVGGSAGEEAAATTSAAPEPEAAPIEWTDCNEQIQTIVAGRSGSDRDLSFDCGRTEVPISYDEPQGATLPLFGVRVVSGTQTDRIGSLMVNPGGPGASGADAAIGLALTLPEEILARFDIVGFDPRGVGLSTPVECIPDERHDEMVAAEPRPVSDEDLDAAFAFAQKIADGCAEEYGDALGTFNTVDSARDLDRLREALGDEQLTYLGYSYGTTLGSTYAELFPENVRAMVLDAAVDPDTDLRANAEERAAGLEAGFDAFAANCVGLLAGCPLGAEPRQFVEQVLTQAAAAPIPSSEPGETRQATPGVVLTAIRAGLTGTESWPQLAQALAAAQAGDSKGLFSLADSYSGRLEDGTYSNLFDANIAINCADREEQFEESEIRELAAEWNAQYPLFGAGSAIGLYTCSLWDAERTPLPERDADGSAPILVIGTSGDPVTPLPGAVDLAEDLESAALLTWQGQGHTAYPKTDCVTAAVNAYLIDLVVPMDGLTCPA